MRESEGGSRHAAIDLEASDPQTHLQDQSEDALLPFNVMLTCYSLFERDSVDQQADRSFLKKWDWSHLLLDEAHAVKNANAMRTKRLTRCASCTHHDLQILISRRCFALRKHMHMRYSMPDSFLPAY